MRLVDGVTNGKKSDSREEEYCQPCDPRKDSDCARPGATPCVMFYIMSRAIHGAMPPFAGLRSCHKAVSHPRFGNDVARCQDVVFNFAAEIRDVNAEIRLCVARGATWPDAGK